MTDEAYELKKILQDIVKRLGMLDENEKSCCGVSTAQCHALVVIGEAGALSLNSLAKKMSLDKSTLSRTINSLVMQGYCQREEQSNDRRYVSIRLTQSGDVMYAKVKQGMDAYFENIYNTLPKDKRKQVLESIGLLLDAIRISGDCREGACNYE